MAAGAGAIRAGAAFVEIEARDGKFRAGLAAAERRLAAFASGIARISTIALGAGIAGGAVALSKAAGTLSDLARVGETAQAFGSTVEKMSGLLGVMEAAGSGTKESIESITQFGTAISNALEGKGEQAQELFTMLGRSADEFKKVDAAEGVFQLFDAIKQVNDPLQKMRALSLAFGTDGMKLLLPMLNKSNEELRRQSSLYAVTGAEVERARQASVAYTEASAALDRAWRSIAVTLAPVVEGIADAVATAGGGLARFVSVNRDAVDEAVRMAAAGSVLTARLNGLGPSVDSLTASWKSFTAALSSGDLASAGRVTFAALNVEFARGLDALAGHAETGANAVLAGFTAASDGIRDAFQRAFQQIGKWINIYAAGLDKLGIGGGQSLRGIAAGMQAGAANAPAVPRVTINGGLTGPAAENLDKAKADLLNAQVAAAFRAAFRPGKVDLPPGVSNAINGFGQMKTVGGFLGGGGTALEQFGFGGSGVLEKQLEAEKTQVKQLDRLIGVVKDSTPRFQ